MQSTVERLLVKGGKVIKIRADPLQNRRKGTESRGHLQEPQEDSVWMIFHPVIGFLT